MTARTPEHYLAQLQALLPPGAAWPRDLDATLTQVLLALADEFARLDARTFDLLDESDPRTVLEMLIDWERVFGLPEPCAKEGELTFNERRENLVEKVTRLGGQSRQYFIEVAARIGFEITITEFRPHHVMRDVMYPLYDIHWVHHWQVNGPEETVKWHTVMSGVNEPLASWGNELLECNIRRLRPAHTTVQFAYG